MPGVVMSNSRYEMPFWGGPMSEVRTSRMPQSVTSARVDQILEPFTM